MNDFRHDVAGIAALEDDLRRELYEFVSAQPRPVSREQAAQSLNVPAHQAKFHLDRLEEAGLLESEYVRLTGRSGPGAGRPAKVYRRRACEISVSLPRREYGLAGELMATAIDDTSSTGRPVVDALVHAARTRGAEMGRAMEAAATPLDVAKDVLSRFGYEPRLEGSVLVLANCPFHDLALGHPQLVCGMNHGLLEGLCERVGGLSASLEPRDGHCCVAVRQTSGAA